METFAARGPTDSRGRSLRELDLERRLFRYPLSYMIYSDAFDALPEDVRAVIYRRIYEEVRETPIFDILLETKPGLPPSWRRD